MPLGAPNALHLHVPVGGVAELRLPTWAMEWQWAAWNIGGASAELRMRGPGFDPSGNPLQQIIGPAGMSIVNVSPGPDVYLRFTTTGATAANVILFVWGHRGD